MVILMLEDPSSISLSPPQDDLSITPYFIFLVADIRFIMIQS